MKTRSFRSCGSPVPAGHPSFFALVALNVIRTSEWGFVAKNRQEAGDHRNCLSCYLTIGSHSILHQGICFLRFSMPSSVVGVRRSHRVFKFFNR